MIRPATHADVGALVLLSEAMHAESPRYRSKPFSGDKMARLFAALIGGAGFLHVAEHDGEVVGGMAGYCEETFFGPSKVAGEYGLFVRPDKRGSVAAVALVRAFVQWAQGQGDDVLIQCGVTTGTNPDVARRLYLACGFAETGGIYEFKGA